MCVTKTIFLWSNRVKKNVLIRISEYWNYIHEQNSPRNAHTLFELLILSPTSNTPWCLSEVNMCIQTLQLIMNNKCVYEFLIACMLSCSKHLCSWPICPECSSFVLNQPFPSNQLDISGYFILSLKHWTTFSANLCCQIQSCFHVK